MASNSHAVMKSSLARALIESGVHHFDLGGPVQVGNGSAMQAPVGGFIGQLLGSNNFQAQGANIQQGTNQDQLNQAYNQAQQGLTSQNAFANSLAPQGAQAIGNQQQLANNLLNQSNGVGPNPAQNALNQATGNNVQNQAALMASQRGASANPALVARNAAMQGANTEQQAIGQGATLQSQQQLNAQQQLGNLSNQQLNQTMGANQNYNNGVQNEQQMLQNANTQANNSAVGMQSNINNVDAQTSAANSKQGGGVGKFLNGITGGISSISSMFADGGEVGGPQIEQTPNFSPSDDSAKSSGPDIGKIVSLASMMMAEGGQVSNQLANQGPNIEATSALPVDKEEPDSPTQKKKPKAEKDTSVKTAGGAADATPGDTMLAAKGGKIPGKSKFPGNDYRNDVVPALLSKGEIVLPESVTQAPNMEQKAIAFLEHLKDVKGKQEESGYGKVAGAKKSLKERVEHLEKLYAGGKV